MKKFMKIVIVLNFSLLKINSEIFQKFFVRIIKISNNNSFLYVKKQILNIITFDKLNLLKYLFLMFFKKIRDKFKN